MSKVHSLARTTPLTRTKTKNSKESSRVLAARYHVTRKTVRKWKRRDNPQDCSHRPHTLQTTLSPIQEAIAVEVRRTLLLPLDDLLTVVREFVYPQASRPGLDRCLRRHGVSNLQRLRTSLTGDEPAPVKTFQDYAPGFIHVDIKYLPQMPDTNTTSG